MNIEELIHDLRARINPQYYDQIGTESYERHQCVMAIESLLARNEVLRKVNEINRFDTSAMNQSLDLLREENDRLRVQLAGCGVAAMQNTADSRKDRIKSGDYGWSASYSDVCGAVDREIALREENERLRKDADSVIINRTLPPEPMP